MSLFMSQQLGLMELAWLFLLNMSLMMIGWGSGAIKIVIGDKIF